MTSDEHDHASPDRAAQQTTLDLARAILARDEPAARRIIADAGCPSCVAIAAMQLGFMLCAMLRGEPFMPEPLRLQLVAAVDGIQAGLRAAPN